MKKQDSKKTIPLLTKKAEIIFSLPNCQPTGSYYLPQINQQNGYFQQNPPTNNQTAQQQLNQTNGIVRSASGTAFHPSQQQSQRTVPEIRKVGSQKVLTRSNHALISNGPQTQSQAQLSQTQQENKKTNIPPTIPFINLERDNYAQDIARRKLFMQDLHSDLQTKQYISEINQISKQPPKKKTRRHKTKFHIVKTNKNIEKLSNIICNFIQDNKKFTGSDVAVVPQYEKNAPFAQSTLDFADQLIEDKQHFKEKYGFDENNLRRNKCVLEQVVLNRMEKRVRTREKNQQLKKAKQGIPDNPYYYDGNSQSIDGDDIIARLEKPVENKNIQLALPKIQEANEEN
ncbi:hypothetical protein ABPG74_005548 [Tetrahymena malaccensis]